MIPFLTRTTPEDLLGRWINLQDFTAAPLLLKWLSHREIKHGLLDGGEESSLSCMVDAAQRHFQRYYDAECQFPKARTDIDIRAEDAQYSLWQRWQHFKDLKRLGLLYHQFALPQRPIGKMLWHAAYAPELFDQIDTMLDYVRHGITWDETIFLGAQRSVGEDVSVGELLDMFLHRRRYRKRLRDAYNPESIYWNAPCTALVEGFLQALCRYRDLPDCMRRVQWIAAPDTKVNGQRKLANTLITLESFADEIGVEPACDYAICTRAPTSLRQWLITVDFLCQKIQDFLPRTLSIISAPYARPLSAWVAGREASNVLWQLLIARRHGIRLANDQS